MFAINMKQLITIGATLIALIVGVVAVEVLRPGTFSSIVGYSITSEEEALQLDSALNFASSGDFDSALKAAEELLNSAVSEGIAFEARSIIDSSKFATGEQEARVEAVRLTKEHYLLRVDDPLDQALQVNKLLGYMTAGREKYVFNEVFAGEPFNTFLVPGDRDASIKNLAEHSLSLHPTIEATVRIGEWYARKIERLPPPPSLTPGQSPRQPGLGIQYADKILETLRQSDQLLEQQKKELEGRPFDYMVEPRYYFWRVYLYSTVALIRPRYLADAEFSLERLVTLYEETKNPRGEKYATIAMRLPNAYYLYAWSLFRVRGEREIDSVRSSLDSLIALVDQDPKIHEGQFLSLIRNAADLTPEQRAKSYRGFVVLANNHPPFKAFLEKYDWKFE